MNEERERLRAIVEHPEDRTPRRAYADWVVARGGPQGEYIRARRRLARLSNRDGRRQELLKRATLLYHESTALLGFRFGPCSEWLPGDILVDAARYTAENREPALLATATRLTISHPYAWPFAFHSSPWLDGVIEMTFHTKADCYPADGIGEAGARTLASTLREPRLTKLDLSGNAIGDGGVRALAESLGLVRLKQLHLGGGLREEFGPPASNHIGDEGARTIADSPNLSALMCLDLAHNAIGDEGARAFAASSSLPSLKVLHLGDNRIGYPGAWALVDSPLGSRLTLLDLANNRTGLGSSPIADWDGSIVEYRYREDMGDPEWLRLRPRLLRFLPVYFPRHGEPLPLG